MKPEEFPGRVPAALTRKAVARAVEASAMRYEKTVVIPDAVRPVWASARAQAKASALAVVDVKTPGPTRDAAWAAVAAAMDAAGAQAVQASLDSETFAALVAPWAYLTTAPPAPTPPTEAPPPEEQPQKPTKPEGEQA